MAISVNIDFENVLKISSLSEDLKIFTFDSPLENNEIANLKVEISEDPHELMPYVFNLAFGPMKSNGEIDDKAELKHLDYSKVFSTILFNAFGYLQKNPFHFIGIDGSDNTRAYLYFRFIQKNHDYLNKFFNVYGLKYYVRITRFGKLPYEDPFDFEDIYTNIQPIGRKERIKLLYNYFIFGLKN